MTQHKLVSLSGFDGRQSGLGYFLFTRRVLVTRGRGWISARNKPPSGRNNVIGVALPAGSVREVLEGSYFDHKNDYHGCRRTYQHIVHARMLSSQTCGSLPNPLPNHSAQIGDVCAVCAPQRLVGNGVHRLWLSSWCDTDSRLRLA